MTRSVGPYIEGLSSYFLSINRGKKSITLDLRNEKAKQVVFELVKTVDIFIENFRPGVMARLGLTYDTIRAHNPQIIYCSISGFGQSGPYSQRPAFDMIAQGMGGVVSITGEPGGTPVRVGYSIGDMGAATRAPGQPPDHAVRHNVGRAHIGCLQAPGTIDHGIYVSLPAG